MKRLFSPLVWLCAAGTLALGALTLFDPNGVYAGYIAALDRDTPAIAAVFTAAQDGIYPWSVPESADAVPFGPAYHPLTETVTDEEMRSSVGNNEPFSEPVPEDFTPYLEVVRPSQDIAPEEDDPEQDAPTAPGFVTVDAGWFNDALFIGDSHIEGLSDYGGLPNATYYFKRGLDIWSVMNKAFVGGKQTIPQALATRKFGKIYIMLGINEIGCGTTESFAEQYGKVVAQLRELQPDAYIYIQGIFHTSQKKSDTSLYNNDIINARNAAIAALADGERVFFLDCNAAFDDENGALTASYSGDGVHVKAPYYTLWRDYLFRFGLEGVAVGETPAPVPPAPPVPVSASEAVKPAAPANEEPAADAAAQDAEETPAAESAPADAAAPQALDAPSAADVLNAAENAEPVSVPEPPAEELPDAPVPSDPTVEPAAGPIPETAESTPESSTDAAAASLPADGAAAD